MKRQKILLVALLFIGSSSLAQQQINLSTKLDKEEIKEVNRTISHYGDVHEAVEMNAYNSDGLGILEDITFTEGIIEVELLGENDPGKSFIGIAFNIQDNETYEAVYFRPFNFVATEQIRKEHMVQYIFHPEFTWRKLREERTEEFENEIANPPNPDAWFKAIIKVDAEKVEVFVNEMTDPVLTIDRLATSTSKKIALWTGYGASGRFRNLVLLNK